MPARPKNCGLTYLRRSGGKQEMSLSSQLSWAMGKSAELGVRLDATHQDLDYMLKAGLHSYKSIRLDNAVTGADMERPGFLATRDDVLKDRSISHLFIHMRDRFARPEEAMPMAMTEKTIRQSGVKLILSNGIGHPLEFGNSDLGEDLKVLVEYYMSGDFLRKLAERIIDAQRRLAHNGHWTGGTAPWGFTRVLVDAAGNVLEELPVGRTVKQQGCHVQLRPREQDKLQHWTKMLDLVINGWGSRRIANHLNDLGVSSPNVGRIRRDRGVPHVNNGKWNPRSALEILRNPAIIGTLQYGRRSMGAHRRLSSEGFRNLEDGDRTSTNTPRVIRNAKNVRIQEKGGYEPLYDPEKWMVVQSILDERGEDQSGIPRISDLSKYPLSCLVVDMTNNCGSLMYARGSGERRLYVCGRYMKHGPTACDNNTVDAEALLTVVLGKIERFLSAKDTNDRLHELLRKRAEENKPREDRHAAERELIEAQIAQLESEKSTVLRRMRTADDVLYQDLKNEYDVIIADLTKLTKKREATPQQVVIAADPEQQVGAALSLIRKFRHVASDPGARQQIPEMLKKLGVLVGLNFRAGVKGRREVRKLEGGVLAFRGSGLPVKLHGRDHHDEHVGDDVTTSTSEKARNTNKSSTNKKSRRGRTSPPAAKNPVVCPQEGISYTKGSRGDRI